MASPLWSRPVFRLLATQRCRVAAPWFVWTRANDAVSRLHRLGLELEVSALRGVGSLERAVAAIVYLPWSLVGIISALRQFGGAVAGHYGVSRRRQFRQLLAYAWRLGLPPRSYYQLRLHRHDWRRTGRLFLDQAELHHLQRHISPADIGSLEDKTRFAARARQHGLPLAPVFAIWRHGRACRVDGSPAADGLRQENLFIKPTTGYSSAGVMGLHYEPKSQRYFDEHRGWTGDDLRVELARRSFETGWLVQPWLENRADLRGFSRTALCNIRLLTAREPNGEIVPLMAALRFPWKSRISSSEPGVTLCASVDLERGVLRAAEARNPTIGQWVRHPQSGQQIEGFRLQGWRELLEVGFSAHRAWPEFPFIGWDLAFTRRGVMLLEGGPLWGAALAQIAGSGPLGATCFPRIFFSHLHGSTPPVESFEIPSYAQSA